MIAEQLRNATEMRVGKSGAIDNCCVASVVGDARAGDVDGGGYALVNRATLSVYGVRAVTKQMDIGAATQRPDTSLMEIWDGKSGAIDDCCVANIAGDVLAGHGAAHALGNHTMLSKREWVETG
jgi:hypothetical protein